MKVLPYSFYQRDTVSVARELLGKLMLFDNQGTSVGGIVVETEAYLGVEDAACHSARGKNKRNAAMFGPKGFAYIYLIYGMYLCFNVTTGPEDSPEAVLIRALEPVAGVDLMRKNRGKDGLLSLCSGPGKLVQALGIDMSHNGTSVVEGKVQFFDLGEHYSPDIVETTRVGITKAADLPLRFYIEGNRFISKK
jgi:DNA-3-methyladenine glycosylase